MPYWPSSPEIQLKRRISIERLVEDRDEHGELRQVYEDDRIWWADVRPISGREFWYAQQTRSEVTHRVVMRWFQGLTPNHRIRLGERIFGIESVQDLEEEHQFYLCMCKEVVR